MFSFRDLGRKTLSGNDKGVSALLFRRQTHLVIAHFSILAVRPRNTSGYPWSRYIMGFGNDSKIVGKHFTNMTLVLKYNVLPMLH